MSQMKQMSKSKKEFYFTRDEDFITINLDGMKFKFHHPKPNIAGAYAHLVVQRLAWGSVYSPEKTKLEEEFRELWDAINKYDEDPSPRTMRNLLEELGDVFNVVASLGEDYNDIGICAVDLVNSMTGLRFNPLMNAMLIAAEHKSLLCSAANLLHKASPIK